MSNASILDRLKAELDAFGRKERSSDEFSVTLYACVEAMDGISQQKRSDLRRIQYALDRGCLEEREGRFSDRGPIIKDIREWLADAPTENSFRFEVRPETEATEGK